MSNGRGQVRHPQGDLPQAATGVWLYYRREAKVLYWAGKKQEANEVQTSSRSGFKQQLYPLQYAPHHLIPGNESLKVSRLVARCGTSPSSPTTMRGGRVRFLGAHGIEPVL